MLVCRRLLFGFACLILPGCDAANARGKETPAAAPPVASVSAAPAPAPPALPSDLNLLLITVDALRADMPWVGYSRDVAPNLTKLAEKSVVYTHAYALSSYTSMSLGGLMAARYPSELPRNGLATSTFGEEAAMLAEVVHGAGIRTLGVFGHVYFAGATGISQGFDEWKLPPKITSMPARDGAVVDAELADLMMAALEKNAGQRFFAWVHFMDPHFSYARHEGHPRFTDAANAVAPGVELTKIGQGLRNQYDGEVVFTDAQIGRLLEFVEKQPWGAKTVVVVTSDHGEAFGEHKSYFEHGFTLWDVTTRVPLLVRVPGVKPARVDTRRSHIDLARTMLEILRVAAPESMRGTSLLPELLGAMAEARDVVIDMPYTDQTPRRRALIHDGKKIVVTETEEEPELYDLEKDPGEQQDLRRSNGELVSEMKKRWDDVNTKLPDYPAPRRGKREY